MGEVKELHRDEFGILGQIQEDGSIEGGDSVNWQGHEIFLDDLVSFPFVFNFEVADGGWVRHPDARLTNKGFGAYYKNPWNGCISRDQMTGIIVGLMRQKKIKALIRLGLNWACRGFLFAYNTIDNGHNPKTAQWKLPDITFMNIWALYLRSFGLFSWVFWPVLWVLDLHMLFTQVWYANKTITDPISNDIKLLACREFVPTPVSIFAFILRDQGKARHELKAYWGGWRDQRAMVEKYMKHFNKY